MQVFLPYPDLAESVACLDPKRLGNQVYRECLTLLRGKWPNHPASRMWSAYKSALATYALYGLAELDRRGRYYWHWKDEFKSYLQLPLILPPWLGDERIHSSHRAALLYKDYKWYSRFGWTEAPAVPNSKGSLPYYWVVP